MIADCRQCEQRQRTWDRLAPGPNLARREIVAKKICRRGLRTRLPFARALPGATPPLRMLTISWLMISTLTVSMLTIRTHLVSTHIISTLTISTLRMRPSERSLT